ncbi:Uncharacterised protein [Vibrio cholerae]|nr:Uncharacterised protein [Vibrio cholerae]
MLLRFFDQRFARFGRTTRSKTFGIEHRKLRVFLTRNFTQSFIAIGEAVFRQHFIG